MGGFSFPGLLKTTISNYSLTSRNKKFLFRDRTQRKQLELDMHIRTGPFLAIAMLPGLTASLAAAPIAATDMHVDSISPATFIEHVAHRRAHSRAAAQSGAASSASTGNVYNDYTGFGSGGRMNADDDFAFGGYDPDFVVDYRNRWNTPGLYNDGFGYGASYGMGMWGW